MTSIAQNQQTEVHEMHEDVEDIEHQQHLQDAMVDQEDMQGYIKEQIEEDEEEIQIYDDTEMDVQVDEEELFLEPEAEPSHRAKTPKAVFQISTPKSASRQKSDKIQVVTIEAHEETVETLSDDYPESKVVLKSTFAGIAMPLPTVQDLWNLNKTLEENEFLVLKFVSFPFSLN